MKADGMMMASPESSTTHTGPENENPNKEKPSKMRSTQRNNEEISSHALPNAYPLDAAEVDTHMSLDFGMNQSQNRDRNDTLSAKAPGRLSHFGDLMNHFRCKSPSKSAESNEDEGMTCEIMSTNEAMGSELEHYQEAGRKSIGKGSLSIVSKWAILLSVFVVIILCWVGQRDDGKAVHNDTTAAENIPLRPSTSTRMYEHEWAHHETTSELSNDNDQLNGSTENYTDSPDPTPPELKPQTSSQTYESDYSGVYHSFKGKKPNFLVILADDVGTGDLPAYWNSSLVNMPHLNRLAKMGVTFMDAHSTPLCAPSRYMFLSGNYQHRGRSFNGRWNVAYSNNQFQSHQKSIAEVLRDQAGYHTAMFGKWHLGAKVPPHGLKDRNHYLSSPKHDWNQQLIDGPQDIGFDKSYITTGGIQFPPYSFFRNGYLTTNATTDTTFWEKRSYYMPRGISQIIKSGEGDKDWDSTAYNQILVKETQQFIENHIYERPNDPFFAYVGLGSVHLPHSPPYTYTDGSPIKGENPTPHMDVLYELDKVVGSLVSTVEDNGLARDTVIIFTSDNGGLKWDSNFFHHSSGPLRGNKGQIWEGGHRVPMIIRYPFFPSGEKRDQLVGLNDLYATICELVGIPVPFGSAQDSVSFAKLLYSRNNLSNARTSLATWDYKSGMLEAEAIRSSNLKLIRHVNPPKIEVYDLGVDLSEANDISRYIPSSIKNNMLKELNELGPCPNDVTDPITLSNGNQVTCSFFRKDKDRCHYYPEGESKCNSVCGRHRKMCEETLGQW